MPVSRMRMRPWLENMIDSESIAGLNWVNKEERMFAIPWKHAARHGWEMDKDASLFKLWAIHTGKYVEGQACDPKTWKANFRCAMNSLPDIEEVKGRSINKGHQAVRVFRMLPANTKTRAIKQSKARETKSKKKVKMDEDIEYSDTQSPVDHSQLHDTSLTQDNRIESTVLSDFPMISSTDVPEWSLSVEIGSDNFSENFSHRFEVSPQESPEHNYEFPEISENLDLDWSISTLNGIELLTINQGYSPGSQWSEASSGEDSDELPKYTVLGQDSSQPMSNIWNFC